MLRQKSFVQPNVLNPFVHPKTISIKRKFQVLLMSLTIAPVRLFCFTLVTFITIILALPITFGVSLKSEQPVSKIRYFLFEILRLLGRLSFFCCGFHFVEVCGERKSSLEAPILVAAPHSSIFDGIVALINFGLPTAVSRAENPQPVKSIIKALQPVLVSRDDPNSRQNTINEIVKRANSKGAWPHMLIFPEGTCTNGKSLITFKKGAFIPGKAVQPVTIEYLNSWDTFRWTMDGPGAFQIFWMTLCQLQTYVRITYMPVYHPNKLEKLNPSLFAKGVRHEMAKQLNVKYTEHTFEDCRLMRYASNLHLPMEAGLIEFAKLSRKLDIDVDRIKELMNNFSTVANKNESGKMNIIDFSNFLSLPVTPVLQKMFDMYDRTNSGFIDFREYVIGLSLLAVPSVTENTIKFAFKVFDKNCDGMISKDEFISLIQTTQGSESKPSKPLLIFKEIAHENDEISYEQFFKFAQKRPEYAYLFLCYKNSNFYTDL